MKHRHEYLVTRALVRTVLSRYVGVDPMPGTLQRMITISPTFRSLLQFSFQFEANRPIRITFDPRLNDDPGRWQFAQFRPTPRHLIAAAIPRSDPDFTIQLRETVPLVY